MIDFLEDVLPPEVRAELQAHLARCPRCVAFVESYRATPRILRDATAVQVPAGLDASLRDFLRRRGAR